MDSTEIKTAQAAKISDAIRPTLGYLHRLKERMQRSGFPPSDPYFLLVAKAHEAIHHLCVETHYLSCKHGVSRQERE